MKRKRQPLFTPTERTGLIVALVIAVAILLVRTGCNRREAPEAAVPVEMQAQPSDSVSFKPLNSKARRDTTVRRTKKSRKPDKRVPLPTRNPLDEVL